MRWLIDPRKLIWVWNFLNKELNSSAHYQLAHWQWSWGLSTKKRLIKSDDRYDIMSLQMLLNVFQCGVYTCSVTGIDINHRKEHHWRFTRVSALMSKLHHSWPCWPKHYFHSESSVRCGIFGYETIKLLLDQSKTLFFMVHDWYSTNTSYFNRCDFSSVDWITFRVIAAIIPLLWKVSFPSRVLMLWSTLSATYWIKYDEGSGMSVP